ncbi:MAG: hypothetical protein U0103_30100, partial [Candidatus Obscuribacterales bacterium]
MPENSRASTQQRDAEMPPENARKITMIIHSIGELAIPPAGKNGAIHGKEMANVDRHKNAAIAIAGERIVAIGPSDEVLKKHSE